VKKKIVHTLLTKCARDFQQNGDEISTCGNRLLMNFLHEAEWLKNETI